MSDQATCELLSEDSRSKVWRWSFESGQETGMHIHEYDYIAIPVSGGDFIATMDSGEVLEFTQIAGTLGSCGVFHDHEVYSPK